MEDSLRYIGVEPDLTEEEKELEYTVPNVIGKSVSEARDILNYGSLKYKIEGNGETVTDQVPKANVVVAESATVILYTEGKSTDGKVVVPKLVGLSYNEVTEKLSSLGLNLKTDMLEGDVALFKAVSQSPEPDIFVETGTSITVKFEKQGG